MIDAKKSGELGINYEKIRQTKNRLQEANRKRTTITKRHYITQENFAYDNGVRDK